MQESITSKELEVLEKKYQHHVFVLALQASRASDLPPLDKRKFIVPKTTSVGMFMSILRRRMAMPSEKALFLFVGNTLPTSSTTIGELYTTHGKHGYLELRYAGENTFG